MLFIGQFNIDWKQEWTYYRLYLTISIVIHLISDIIYEGISYFTVHSYLSMVLEENNSKKN